MRSIVRLLQRGPVTTARVRLNTSITRRTLATATTTATKPITAIKSTTHDGSTRRKGDEYVLTPDEIASYHRDGYLLAPGILSEPEMKSIEVMTRTHARTHARTHTHARTQRSSSLTRLTCCRCHLSFCTSRFTT